MKRLEHIRTLRNQTSRSQAKSPTGAVMVLAQISQEKQRLQQERGNWERRLQKIDARLREIAGMEQRLCATANFERPPEGSGPTPGKTNGGPPPGFAELTMKY